MSVLQFQKSGTPATLFENARELAPDIRFALVVMLRKDGTITTDWSDIDSLVTALGCAEVLRARLMEEL